MFQRLGSLPAPLRGVLAVGAGALIAAGLPPVDGWPLAFLGFPLFLVLLDTAKSKSWRSGFGLGWAFGLGYFAVAFHWIGYAFFVEAGTYLWMMPFMLGILSGGMAIYWGLAGLLAKRFGGSGLQLTLAFSALLAVAEWLRGHLLTGFPWAAPGLLVVGMGGVAQAASVIGMTGLTLLVVLWASLPYVFLSGERRRLMLAGGAILLLLPALWGWGDWRLAGASGALVPGVVIRIVQPNLPQEEKWREDNARQIFDDLLQLSMLPTAERPDGIGGVTHVIWPESAVPFLIDESPVAKSELKPLLGGRTALITGAVRAGRMGEGVEPDAHNSIIVFDGTAEVAARYDKWRLVPGGEFLPLAWALEPLGFRQVVQTPGSFVPGPGPRTVILPGGLKASLTICYEAIFPDRLVDDADRPQAIVNVTNDGWFGRSTGPWQHLAQARLRTIEQGLPMIRAANTGISAVIDPYGRTLRMLPLMEKGVVDSPLPVAISATAYARMGDFWLLILTVCIISCAFLARFWALER
ncbi:MAG: apolipoprotein N-acyltransferase [Aestuariivirga sp.]|uniref:apolipoprotein N-acyltransferase n=1 Tax=Aestuariivirga sp. TaxID=2650926 RepID=UPI0025BC636C|nr:apolipoprotein N-acyltransferase [Aestuariivirga sp.]MCA3560805.1 apolipoprotein N-acyltransferase [Aestuariivirga sp.]